jgi:hypothetical protein
MKPLCPACCEPMKEQGRAFQCEPCREIIIFFAVSDASPYFAAGKGASEGGMTASLFSNPAAIRC